MILKTIKAEKVVCPKRSEEITLQECSGCKSHGEIRNAGSEVLCKFHQYEKALEVELIARSLIEEHHSHLVEAKILYLFRNGSWKVKRKEKYGNAEKCSGKIKHLTGADFIITVNADIWPHMDTKAQMALIDHELSHCGRDGHDADGLPVWYMIPHTLEDFSAVIRRHGLWEEGTKLMAKAMIESNHAQMQLFKDDQNGLKLVSGNQ